MAIPEAHLKSYLQKKKDNYTQYRKVNYDNKFIENYRLYKSYREPKDHVWQTNIFIPYAFTMIETVLPRIVEYLWQGDKFVTAHPRERTDIDNAKIVDDLIQYQIDTGIDNLFMEWVDMLKTYMIQGTGIGKITWDVLADKASFINVDIFDFYVQPFKKYVEDMDGVFHVFDMPTDIIRDKLKFNAGYVNIDKIDKTSMGTKDEEVNTQKNAEVGRVQNYDPGRKTSLIYQYWGKIPVQESMEVGSGYSATTYEEGLVEIANRETIIRNVKNPYASPGNPDGIRPFVSAKNYTDPGEFYGIGDIEPAKDVMYEANELQNQKMDNLKLAMNKMWIVGGTAGIDLSNMISYPGNVVVADNIEQIKPLEHRDIAGGVSQESEHLAAIIQNTAGVSDYSRGANAPGMSDTVGGITSLIEEANQRFAYKIKVLQMTAVKKFAEKLFKLDQLFIKGAEIPVRLQNEEGFKWLNINPDNLIGMYDFKPVAISMIGNKLARQNTMIKLLEVISKAPPIPSMIAKILEDFDMSNKDEVMNDLMNLWGMNAPAQPGMPSGVTSPTRPGQPVPSPVPVPGPVNDAQVQAQLANQVGVGR